MKQQSGSTVAKKDADHATIVLALDRWQGRQDAERCPHDPNKHGKLAVHGTGQALICAACPDIPGQNRMSVVVPITNEMVNEALAYKG